MKRQIVTAIVAGLLASATAGLAAEKQGQFSISPMAGGYTFEGSQHLKTVPVYGGRVGYNLTPDFGIEALFDYARTEGTKTGDKATMYRFGADLLCNLLPDNRLVPYLALGVSGIHLDGGGRNKELSAALDYGAGLKYFLTDSIALRADVRHLIYSRSSTTFNNLEYTLGAYIPFGGTTPATKAVAADPAPTAPALAEPAPAPVTAPAPVAAPAPAATRIVVPILPITSDADHDGVTDRLDRCPNTPAGVAVDKNGCPTPQTAVQKAEDAKRFCDKPAILAVAFDTGKADIKTAYHAELARVGTFLQEFPDAKGVIEGHTDNAGKLALNMKLSQKRADTVRDYIIQRFGIAASRITAKGFGPTKPVATNKTAAGKTKNRRIEALFTCK